MTSVDVVIVTHDHAATLGATLASLVAQTLQPAHVLVVDNASRDASRELAAAADGAVRVSLLGLDENRGFSGALNEGLRRSTSEWVLSLNPDCRLEPEFLAALLPAARQHERTGAASGLLLRARGEALEPTSVVDSAGMIVSAWGRHFDRCAGRAPSERVRRPAWVFGATGAAALYRRAALDDVAYPNGEVLDERFFAYREDADLAWRLQRRGWWCRYEPSAVAYHARGSKPEAGRAGSALVNRLSVRNRFLLLWANADWRWRVACFPFWWLRDIAVLGACLTVERSSWPGVREAWALRSAQRQRGRANAARATVSGWSTATWFHPFRHVRTLEQA